MDPGAPPAAPAPVRVSSFQRARPAGGAPVRAAAAAGTAGAPPQAPVGPAPVLKDPGTRPGLHGQVLISSGLADLDRLLTGGIPLGSVVLVMEDLHSQQHLNIIKYFLAEGLSCDHRCCWLAGQLPPGGPGQFIPRPARPRGTSSSSTSPASASDQADSPDDPGGGLRIAWQYRKYLQQGARTQGGAGAGPGGGQSSSDSQGAGSSRSKSQEGGALAAGINLSWCHAHDLSGGVGEAALRGRHLECVACAQEGGLEAAHTRALAFIASLPAATTPSTPQLATPTSTAVGRIVIQSLAAESWTPTPNTTTMSTTAATTTTTSRQTAPPPRPPSLSAPQLLDSGALLRCVFDLRAALAERRGVALLTCPTALLPAACALRLQHLAHTVLALGTIADDSPVYQLLPDPQSAVALLACRKLPVLGMVGPHPVDGALYVLRNKRSKLAITVVEVDPDADERKQKQAELKCSATDGSSNGGSGGGGGGKSAAALLCGGPPQAGKALDF